MQRIPYGLSIILITLNYFFKKNEQLQIITGSCKDVTFKIFGFSLTMINMLISLILVILLINIFKNYEKFKK